MMMKSFFPKTLLLCCLWLTLRSLDAGKPNSFHIKVRTQIGNRVRNTQHYIPSESRSSMYKFNVQSRIDPNSIFRTFWRSYNPYKAPSVTDYSQCGMGHSPWSSKPSKIVGGRQASQSWPWLVAMFKMPLWTESTKMLWFSCGGSIVHKYFILTAAHCVKSRDGSVTKENNLWIKAGATKDVKNLATGQMYRVKRIIVHPLYNNQTFDYDIAMLMLKEPIKFNPKVRPICLPPDSSSKSTLYQKGELVVAIGWGHESVVTFSQKGGIKTVENVNEIQVPLQSRTRCLSSLLEHGLRKEEFTDRMLCAGDGKQGKPTCRGDSGGPLMQPQTNKDGKTYWTQIGIVSWGLGCGLTDTYSFFAHVQNLRSWILYTMKGY